MSAEAGQANFEGWAVVEVFGHQKYAGFVTTEHFGPAALFRVDVPPLPERERVTKHYGFDDDGNQVPPGSTVKEVAVQGYTKYLGPGAIFAMTPCTQEVAERTVASIQTRKVSLVSLPPVSATLPPHHDDVDDDQDEDDGEDDTRI